MDFSKKTDAEIEQWIANHEAKGVTNAPLYLALLEERIRRAQAMQKMSFEHSLGHLKRAAIEQRCTTYGAVAAASGLEWSKARHQMNGANGHLDRLLDLCHMASTATAVPVEFFDTGHSSSPKRIEVLSIARGLPMSGTHKTKDRTLQRAGKSQLCPTGGRASPRQETRLSRSERQSLPQPVSRSQGMKGLAM